MAAGTAKPRRVSDPAKADAQWFTEVLQLTGLLGHAVVTQVGRQRIGTGQIGQNVAFSLTYDRPAPEAPTSVGGKVPSPEPHGRAAAETVRPYERRDGGYQPPCLLPRRHRSGYRRLRAATRGPPPGGTR